MATLPSGVATTTAQPHQQIGASTVGASTAGSHRNVGASTVGTSTANHTRANASNWNVSNNQTVSNQISSLLNTNSPYMQQAATQGKQAAASRGLLNSSMAVGAAHGAAIERALPIAQQDASTFANSAQFNAQNQTDISKFNADSANRIGMFNADTTNASNRFNADAMNNMGQFNATEANRLNMFNTGEINSANQFNANALNNMNQFNATEANRINQFNADSANTNDRFNAQAFNDLQKLGLQIDANERQLPLQFASGIVQTLTNGVNAIMADGSLNAGAKQGAIQNLVDYGNAQIAWARSFYGTNIPNITVPTLK